MINCHTDNDSLQKIKQNKKLLKYERRPVPEIIVHLVSILSLFFWVAWIAAFTNSRLLLSPQVCAVSEWVCLTQGQPVLASVGLSHNPGEAVWYLSFPLSSVRRLISWILGLPVSYCLFVTSQVSGFSDWENIESTYEGR